jgi:hypothetical protein
MSESTSLVFMRVIHVDAVQAHAVPSRVYEPRGPFDRYQPSEIKDLPFDPDKFPTGSTAQNGMREVVMYECQVCMAILRDDELDGHVCEGDRE